MNFGVGMCRIDFILFLFGFGLVFEINSDPVWNKFCSVRFEKTWFGLDVVIIYYLRTS